MPTYTFSMSDVSLQSSWVCTSSKITSGPTTASSTETVTVLGVPANEDIESVILHITTSQTLGGAAILTAGGVSLTANARNDADLTDQITGDGTYNIKFVFRDRGRAAMSDGTHRITMYFTNIVLAITTSAGSSEEEQTALQEPVAVSPTNAIILHDAFDRSYTAGLGLCVLTPTSCTVTEEAGGKYSLKMVHPMTDDGRWKLIAPMDIITAPVPLQDTPVIDGEDNAIVDESYDIYTVNAGGAPFYRNKSATYYPAWTGGKWYGVGNKVRYGGINYICKGANAADPWDGRYWTSQGSGAAKADRTLPEGMELTVSRVTGDWCQVKLTNGVNGWVKAAYLTFLRTDVEYATDPEEIAARRVATQAFRINEIQIDSNAGTVTCSAVHISYDYSATIVNGDWTVTDLAMPDAILKLRQGCIPNGINSAPVIATQFPETQITADWSLKPVTEAILDPDDGLVAATRGKLVRDNEDFYILENPETDRGIRLRYGSNLRGVKWTRDLTKLVTYVIPTAKAADGSVIYLEDNKGVESANASLYPYLIAEHLQVDGQVGKAKSDEDSTKWTLDTLRVFMQSEAQKRFDVDHVDDPKVTLTVNFVLLGETEEYAQYRDLERLSLYDCVGVQDPTIGLDVLIRVKAYEWDAILRRYNKITLGNIFDHERQIVAGYALQDGSITARKLSPTLLSLL